MHVCVSEWVSDEKIRGGGVFRKRNWRCKGLEVDLISVFGKQVNGAGVE